MSEHHEHAGAAKSAPAAAPAKPVDASSDLLPAALMLPPSLLGHVDLGRLVREIEALDNELEMQKVRARDAGGGADAAAHLPAMSRTLTDLTETNKLDIADPRVRDALRKQLRAMKDKAATMHLTFAADPEPEFLQQLVQWIRKEINPAALIDVGVQPALIGGVHLRTPNHVHDFSLRTLLAGKRELLVHELEALGSGK